MIYFDTNVYIYAFLKDVDDERQQDRAIEVLEKYLEKKEIITSEVILYEYAFVAKKMGEKKEDIEANLNFIKKFIKPSSNIYERTLEIINSKNAYRSSFDVFHLAFCEYYDCEKFITFDKGFKKLRDVTDVEIVVL